MERIHSCISFLFSCFLLRSRFINTSTTVPENLDRSDVLGQRSILLISGMVELLRAMLDLRLISLQPNVRGQACYSLSLYRTEMRLHFGLSFRRKGG